MSKWIAFILAAIPLLPQAPTRGIIPEEIVKARPTAPAPSAKPAPKYQAIASPARPSAPGKQIGVTVWRLRPASASDGGVRILVQEDATTAEWIPERLASASRLKPFDKVRLTVESPDPGYLYVIDREIYSDGTRGEPYLIFPTSRINSGSNEVAAGRLTDIPAQEDRPNFFSLRPTRSTQSGEELTLLVTAAPLSGIQIGPKPLRLTDAQVAEWDKRWGTTRPQVFELTGGAGQPWTRSEQAAAADRTRILTQDDPPPQTVYRVSAKPDDPLYVKIQLRLQGAK